MCSSQREAIFIDGESVVRINEEKEQALLTRSRRQIVGILVSVCVVFRVYWWFMVTIGFTIGHYDTLSRNWVDPVDNAGV